MKPFLLGLAVLLLGTEVMLLSFISAPAGVSQALRSGFSLEEAITGLEQPVAFAFAPDGRVFVAEKAGRVQSFDNIDDSTPETIIDIADRVDSWSERGLLGLAVDPDFGRGSDYLYLLYTDSLGGRSDDCATPEMGCVANGRLDRYDVTSTSAVFDARLLSGFWCQQFSSHSIADLAFDQDGYLLVSAGDGADFSDFDYGQHGNPCKDPAGEGGSLRSQDLLTAGDPLGYDGTVLRLDPATGNANPENPLVGTGGADDRVIAIGLRNPFRIRVRPGTSEIWIADVGWNTWEEVDRIQDPGGSGFAGVENFGWPCYEGDNEGSATQPVADGLDLPICRSLGVGKVVAPFYSYQQRPPDFYPGCKGRRTTISGLAFYTGNSYPASYQNGLFFADYSMGCIRFMWPGSDGLPDKSRVSTVVSGALAVDLEIGPDDDLFYADIGNGSIVELVFMATEPVVAPDAGPPDTMQH